MAWFWFIILKLAHILESKWSGYVELDSEITVIILSSIPAPNNQRRAGDKVDAMPHTRHVVLFGLFPGQVSDFLFSDEHHYRV